ncbi:MAG: glycosyltransferase [Actinomycetota bacterium]|nr:glycosyltransferase [Actinomycetota bacterium]
MTAWERALRAIGQRIRGPYASLGRLDARLHELQARMADMEHLLAVGSERAGSSYELLDGEIRATLRALASEESENRRRLHRLRASSSYPAAWTQASPLITVTVATRDRPQTLVERALTSILGQTHAELEVIVVGDHADQATAEAVRALGDPRVAFFNLSQRLLFTDDPFRHWLVASTMARNEAMLRARGLWVVSFDDDDAMRPDCLSRLLRRARESDRPEVVYGRAMFHREGEPSFELGKFPPEHGQFTWASGMYHAGLRFLERELFAADMRLPGDWFLAQRMLRSGVRFAMVDGVLSDVYPSAMNRVLPPGPS